jgi:hypothetical protein
VGKKKWVWMGAHEFVCWACNGPPKSLKGRGGKRARAVVCHKCHNSKCLHPRHIEHGSDKENLKTARARGVRERGGDGKFVSKGP